MSKNKKKIQSLIFDKKHFNKSKIKIWVDVNGFVIDKRLKYGIMGFEEFFKVQQRNPIWFNKKTFKTEGLGKGVKGLYGLIK